MASARTAFARALRSTTINTPKPAARRPLSTFSHIRAQPVRPAVKPQSGRSSRNYSSDAAPKKGGKGGLVAGAAVVLGGATYYLYSTNQLTTYFPFLAGFADPEEARKLKTGKGWKPAFEDYQRVYNTIASMLEDDPDYDDGSYAPVLIRLAWHCSGTYDTKTKTGGSNGATMRFAPESGHGANAGLHVARDLMEKVKAEHPWITYSDLWTLAGVAGIQEIGGPAIPWRPGRTDADMSACTPDGRLPDASKGAKHIRDIFYRMGFDDREIVALLGAHAIGRCHDDRSGYSGPWTFSPTYFTNEFYKLLMNEKWTWKKWNGPPQYEDVTSKSLMMLPTDMELIKDKEFSKHTKRYADDEQVFFKEFSEAFAKLLELGVPFERDEKWIFKTLEQQEEEKSKKEKK